MNPICWIKTLWRSLWHFPDIIEGCDYIETATHENCRVSILNCDCCGKVSVGWER